MVDFSETIKEHVETMSPEELAATQARHASRETGPDHRPVLPGLWEPTVGGTDASLAKDIALRIEAAPTAGADAIARFSEGASFQEAIILTPDVYRLIAGGTLDPALKGASIPTRFTISAGGNGQDRVSIDRAALAALMDMQCPKDMARARRLVALEWRAQAKEPTSIDTRVAAFTRNWEGDKVLARLDAVIAKASSRTILLIVGKDHFSLSVRKDEILVGADGFFQSPLAAAIVRPEPPKLRTTILIMGNAEAYRDRDAPFLRNTFGSGPIRRLVIDAAKLRQVMPTLAPEACDAALTLLDKLIARSAELNLGLRPPLIDIPAKAGSPILYEHRPVPPAATETIEALEEHAMPMSLDETMGDDSDDLGPSHTEQGPVADTIEDTLEETVAAIPADEPDETTTAIPADEPDETMQEMADDMVPTAEIVLADADATTAEIG